MSPFPERRTFKHYITGRTINRDLNIPGHLIPEYHPPPTREQEAAGRAFLESIVTYCLAVGESE